VPISREELEDGRIALTFPILRILTESPDLGFSAQEVQQLLKEKDGRDATLVEVELALQALVQRNTVLMGEMEDQRWYTLMQRRLGFRTEQ
jgi:hypothetical protein